MLILAPAARAEPAPPPPSLVIAAGVPRYIGETATDDELFAGLAEAGFNAFLPVFQYQEVPEPRSLDRENTFAPPCDGESGPYPTMRRHGIRLVLPGQLLYQPGMSRRDSDALLAALADCAGPDGIAAVFSVDEPALGNPDLDAREAEVRLIFERTHVLLPGVPVVMVHAPIVTEVLINGAWQPITEQSVADYLAAVERLSRWADIVGFDLYAIPASTAKITAPGLGVNVVDDEAAIPAYLAWLAEHAAGKQTILVLQGFGYADLVGVEPEASSRAPSAAELDRMACAAWRGGVTSLAWWGQSHLDAEDEALWRDFRSTTAAITTDPTAHCG